MTLFVNAIILIIYTAKNMHRNPLSFYQAAGIP